MVRFSQLKIREMLSTLHFKNLPAKMYGNSMKGMISPMASKIVLLCGNLQINSYSQVTVVKAFIAPLINEIAAAPRLSLMGELGLDESNAAPAASKKISIKNKGISSVISGMGNPFTLSMIHFNHMVNSVFTSAGMSIVTLILLANI